MWLYEWISEAKMKKVLRPSQVTPAGNRTHPLRLGLLGRFLDVLAPPQLLQLLCKRNMGPALCSEFASP